MRAFGKLTILAVLVSAALATLGTQTYAQVGGNYASEAQDFGVPPQNTIHMGPPHAATPLTAPGVRTITTSDLYGLLSAHQPMLLLYVNEAQDGLAIAGAHWLDGAGRGSGFDDVLQARLIAKVDQLTTNNKKALVVVFCYDAHCWLSYNVVLRLAQAGYSNVSWYRGGREAWKAAGFPLTALTREKW